MKAIKLKVGDSIYFGNWVQTVVSVNDKTITITSNDPEKYRVILLSNFKRSTFNHLGVYEYLVFDNGEDPFKEFSWLINKSEVNKAA